MITIRPLRSFSVGNRRILTCRILGGNPFSIVGRKYILLGSGPTRKIEIEGISTASDIENDVYDLLYSGDTINPDQINESSLLQEIK